MASVTLAFNQIADYKYEFDQNFLEKVSFVLADTSVAIAVGDILTITYPGAVVTYPTGTTNTTTDAIFYGIVNKVEGKYQYKRVVAFGYCHKLTKVRPFKAYTVEKGKTFTDVVRAVVADVDTAIEVVDFGTPVELPEDVTVYVSDRVFDFIHKFMNTAAKIDATTGEITNYVELVVFWHDKIFVIWNDGGITQQLIANDSTLSYTVDASGVCFTNKEDDTLPIVNDCLVIGSPVKFTEIVDEQYRADSVVNDVTAVLDVDGSTLYSDGFIVKFGGDRFIPSFIDTVRVDGRVTDRFKVLDRYRLAVDVSGRSTSKFVVIDSTTGTVDTANSWQYYNDVLVTPKESITDDLFVIGIYLDSTNNPNVNWSAMHYDSDTGSVADLRVVLLTDGGEVEVPFEVSAGTDSTTGEVNAIRLWVRIDGYHYDKYWFRLYYGNANATTVSDFRNKYLVVFDKDTLFSGNILKVTSGGLSGYSYSDYVLNLNANTSSVSAVDYDSWIQVKLEGVKCSSFKVLMSGTYSFGGTTGDVVKFVAVDDAGNVYTIKEETYDGTNASGTWALFYNDLGLDAVTMSGVSSIQFKVEATTDTTSPVDDSISVDIHGVYLDLPLYVDWAGKVDFVVKDTKPTYVAYTYTDSTGATVTDYYPYYNVSVEYEVQRPAVGRATDSTSVTTYGKCSRKLVLDWVTTDAMADGVAKQVVANMKNPVKTVWFKTSIGAWAKKYRGMFVGMTVTINSDLLGLSGVELMIMNVKIENGIVKFETSNVNTNNFMNFVLSYGSDVDLLHRGLGVCSPEYDATTSSWKWW